MPVALHPEQISYESVTIANGQTTSGAIKIFGTTLCGVVVPASFTGTTLQFQGSHDGTNFNTLYKDGADLSVTVTSSKFVVLQPADFAGVNYLKLVSGSAQTGDKVLYLACRAI
jgi:hypothetical protein